MCVRSTIKSFIICLVSTVLITGLSFAVQAATPAGTVLHPGRFSLQYSDGRYMAITADSTAGDATTVDAIYGIDVTPSVSVTASLTVGNTVYFHQVVINKGNAVDAVPFSLEELTAGGWTAAVYLDSNNNGLHEAEETTQPASPLTVGEEATRSIFIALTAPSAYITPGRVVFRAYTSGGPSGVYTGFNGASYGGMAEAAVTENAELIDTIIPVITPLVPTPGAQQVPVDDLVAFDVTDLEGGVSLNTLKVTVNGTVYVPTSTSTVSNGYRVSIDPATFPYATTISVVVEVLDNAGNRGIAVYEFKTRALSAAIDLTAYLHGYMNTGTRVHREATINVQLRPTRNIDDGPSVNVSLSSTGNTGVFSVGADAGNYYLVIRQVIAGAPLGVNHVAYVSSESIMILAEGVTTLNITTVNSSYYVRPFIPRSGYSPLLLENGMLLIKGGEATGERVINVTDIIRWNNAATNASADTRGKAAWSEDPNFDGDPYMNTDDFSIWNKNKGQSVPMPEED